MIIYKLENKYTVDSTNNIIKRFLIGFFDSLKTVNNIINNYRNLPGFCDHTENFVITEYTLYSKTKHVYYVTHEYYVEEEDYDVVTEIGVFLTKKSAVSSILELRRDEDELCRIDDSGFNICKHRLNDNYWQEGYVPW